MSTLLQHNIGKISESSLFSAVVRELLLLTHTRGNVISHVMVEGGIMVRSIIVLQSVLCHVQF